MGAFKIYVNWTFGDFLRNLLCMSSVSRREVSWSRGVWMEYHLSSISLNLLILNFYLSLDLSIVRECWAWFFFCELKTNWLWRDMSKFQLLISSYLFRDVLNFLDLAVIKFLRLSNFVRPSQVHWYSHCCLISYSRNPISSRSIRLMSSWHLLPIHVPSR